ncbi:uncharacterized protein SRS1_10067 [Sporisorium reilianum f. sp. reilianum]|uniref:Secreted protein n=1 Tax=Sporisorium reilianum f. sp. reilianum TaxID=72559 RepID=A0A2N8ULE9_9BASI|nr:uncharacterized protein SRS1_10067 [Sporisorium reilianum f. sp. reilianum]
MLYFQFCPALVVMTIAFAMTSPKPALTERGGTGNDRGLAAQQPGSSHPRGLTTPSGWASSEIEPHTASSSLSHTILAAKSEPFFTHFPQMPNDVLRSMLSDKISLQHLTAVQQYARRRGKHCTTWACTFSLGRVSLGCTRSATSLRWTSRTSEGCTLQHHCRTTSGKELQDSRGRPKHRDGCLSCSTRSTWAALRVRISSWQESS